ncbi:MAG: aminotransferase class I/II-fold pyridoxal phosphate-dependent enzyme [Bacteroidales bacterium]|nr:aminotransferase class I/II-fold pyridoxal phosphate-dependent enzyme [Bacteroidales bacterium]
MVDIFDKIKKSRGPLGQYQQIAHGYFMFPKLEGEIGPRMRFRGKEVLNWSLNNYLGLANLPEVRQADAEAAKEFGMAYPMGARMMSGQTTKHEELEDQLAAFVGKEDAFLLNYGYQGMISIIDSLLGRNDVVVYDSESHACIVDGLRLHIGKRFVFPHNNMQNLEKELERATKMAQETGGGILVITEGVFGMAGDLGNLKAIVELKKKFDFRILVDDAHGFGTMGKSGAGTGEHFGVQEDIDLYFSTFAKSMAGIGAFIAGQEDVINFLRYNMRSQTYAKSLPMPMVIGALKRLELIRTRPEIREKLWTIVRALQSGFKAKGLNLGNTESPVTPVFLSGSVPEATNVVIDLRENYKIFCSMVVYPVVPKDVVMLRIIPTSAHTLQDVEYTVNSFAEIQEKLKAGKYKSDKIASLLG